MNDRRTAGEESRADWQTPAAFYEFLDSRFHFTLDGAAMAHNAKCPRYYGPDSLHAPDAFAEYPDGEVIFVNPPYGRDASTGRDMRDWMRLFDRWQGSNSIVALLPANTETEWFWYCYQHAAQIIFLKGRIQFEVPEGQKKPRNPVGSALVIWYWRGQKKRGPAQIRWWDWQRSLRASSPDAAIETVVDKSSPEGVASR